MKTKKNIYLTAKDLLKKEKKIQFNHPYLYILQKLWHELRYIIFYRIFEDIPFYIKRFWQRGIMGYSDSDTWGFEDYLANVIMHGLILLRRHIHDYPLDMKSLAQWDLALGDMIYTFWVIILINNDEMIMYVPKKKWQKHCAEFKYCTLTRKEYRRYKKGWKLFQKYFFNLWD